MTFKTFKNVLLSSAAVFALSTSVSADVIWSEDFETDGNGVRYTTNTPEFSDGAGDFFTRIDQNGTNVGSYYEISGQSGEYYFAGMDIDGEGASLPVTMTFTVDISGATDLVFKGLFAEDDDGVNQDWDDADYFYIEYQIDGGGWNKLIQFAGIPDGDAYNHEPAEDTDFDNIGDGVTLSDVLTEFTKTIAGTGSTLELRVTISLNAGDEDIAFDNLRVEGTVAAPSVADQNDFNADGHADILFEKADGSYIVQKMDANGTAGQIFVSNPSKNWEAKAIADFDANGYNDILFIEPAGDLRIAFFDASGKVNSLYLIGNRGWMIEGTGDFNNDSSKDILFRKMDGSLIAMYISANGKAGQQFISADRNRSVEAVADFDANGYADILFQEADGSRIVWYMGANGKESNLRLTGPAQGLWKVKGTGDFNSDGNADVLFQKPDETNLIWTMNGAGKLGKIDITKTWNAQSIGDYNNDGYADILFKRPNGSLSVLLMNAGGEIGSIFVMNDQGWIVKPSETMDMPIVF